MSLKDSHNGIVQAFHVDLPTFTQLDFGKTEGFNFARRQIVIRTAIALREKQDEAVGATRFRAGPVETGSPGKTSGARIQHDGLQTLLLFSMQAAFIREPRSFIDRLCLPANWFFRDCASPMRP